MPCSRCPPNINYSPREIAVFCSTMHSRHLALRTSRNMLTIVAALALLALFALMLALAIGSVPVTFGAIVRGLTGASDTEAAIVRDLRLPRALAAFATGGLLALAGALMQVLLRN